MGVSPENLKRAGVAFLASAAFTGLVFLTSPTVYQGPDFVRLHGINRQYAATRLAQGELPLWNPYVGLGRPFLADIETAFFYPPNVVYLVLDPLTGLALLAVLHGALGLLAMRSFCGHLGATGGAAWAGGVVWLAGAPFVEELLAGRSPYAWGIAYVPLAFLAARSAQDDSSVRSLARLALVLCLQLLAGHPHIAWITWFGLGWFVLGRTRATTGASAVATSALRSLVILALALAWAFALGAVQLLPFAELAAQGNRSRGSFEFAASGAMKAAEWASLVLVPAFSQQHLLYVGMVALLAGVCGLLAIGDPDRRGLLTAAVAAAALAAGPATPVFRWFYWLVPGVSTFRNPSRAGFLVSFALVAAAAAHVSSPESSRRRWILPAATALALCAVLAGHGASLAGPGRGVGWGLGLIVCSAGALVWWQRTSTSRRPAAGLTLILLTMLDLGTAIAAHKGTISWSDDLRAEPAVVRALNEAGLFDRSGVPPRICVPYWIVRDNAGTLYGYSTFTGYVSLTLGRVWAYVHDVLGTPRPELENTYPSKEIYARGPFPYATMNLRLGFDPVGNTLVVRQAPDPRAYLAPRIRVVHDWPEALRLMIAGHDPHREALVEEPLAFPAPGAWAKPGTASITRFTPELVVVDVETDEPAILVVAEAWFPGWHATVNGKPAPCVPANVWMRAVAVPAGRSEVQLHFRSTYLAAGAAISLVSLLALCAALRSRVVAPRA